MGNSNDDPRLNQMGIAVWLLDPGKLPPMQLREKPDLHGLSTGKAYVLKEQAKVFLKAIPDLKMRKYFCTIGSGQGIVVRFEPAGKKAYYDLSLYFKRALDDVPPPE